MNKRQLKKKRKNINKWWGDFSGVVFGYRADRLMNRKYYEYCLKHIETNCRCYSKKKNWRNFMYITFVLVDNDGVDYPENIKCFSTKEEAYRYKDYHNEVCIEEVEVINKGFDVYQYMTVTYQVEQDPDISFKFTTSLDKHKNDIDSVYACGNTVYVHVNIRNKLDGYKKLPKILDALNALFFNARTDDDPLIHHKVGITDIDKTEFFERIK